MNKITLNDLKKGKSFSEDSFIYNEMFFLPKNFPIQDYHIKILKAWNIDEIATKGILSDNSMITLVREKPTKTDKIDQVFNEQPVDNTKNNQISEKLQLMKNELPVDFSKPTDALLDNSVKGFFELYKKWIRFVYNTFNDIIFNKTVDKEKVKNFIIEIINTVNKNRNNALMIFGKKFEGVLYTIPQTIETIILSYIIGDSLQLTQLELSNLAIASLFHDIGMLRIPKPLLEKKEALTPQEIKVIQNHTASGYKLLRDVRYSAIIASGALQHHERMDGKGYPNALPPDKVTGIAKIISVADAYCAAIAAKPFKSSPLHAKEVIQDLLRGGGTAYDPNILKELIKNISFYPIGSLVLLSNKKPARVVGTSGVAMKPIVKTIEKDKEEGTVINLSQNNNIYIIGLHKKE